VKPYIQIGDSFFKVVHNNGSTDIVKVKPEEAIAAEMEKIVLTDVEEIEVSMFQEIIDKARSDLKTSLERNLKSTVLNALGFEKDTWGSNHGWKVDHCNGRMSAVTNLISEEVKTRLLEVEIGRDFTLTEQENKELKASAERDFKEAYRRKMREFVWNKAEQLASKHVEEWISELAESKLKEISKAMLEKTLKNAR
jgi:hypothetical protein